MLDESPIVFARAGWSNRIELAARTRLEKALDERDGERSCFYCATSLSGWAFPRVQAHVDHVTPRGWRGGSDRIDNLVWACRRCNLLKGDTPGWFFVLWLWARRNQLGIRVCVSPEDAWIEDVSA